MWYEKEWYDCTAVCKIVVARSTICLQCQSFPKCVYVVCVMFAKIMLFARVNSPSFFFLISMSISSILSSYAGFFDGTESRSVSGAERLDPVERLLLCE